MLTNVITPATIGQINALLQQGSWSIRGCPVSSAAIEGNHLIIGKFRRSLGSKEWSFNASEATIRIMERNAGKTHWKKAYEISNSEPLKLLFEGLVAQRQRSLERESADQIEQGIRLAAHVFAKIRDLAGASPVEIDCDAQTVKIVFSNGKTIQISSGDASSSTLLIGTNSTDLVPIGHGAVISL